MTRIFIFLTTVVAAAAMPSLALAHCGTTSGSFSVSCEKGVIVYRHNSYSTIPRGLSAAQAKLEVAKIKQKATREKLAAQSRAKAAELALREREIELNEARAAAQNRSNGRRLYYATTFGGFQLAQVRGQNRRRAVGNAKQH